MTKLKKICVLAILAIFLISLMPMALADKPVKPKEKPLKEKLLAVAGKATTTLEKAKIKVENANAQYQQAKERYQEAKQKYLETKERVRELRTAIQECVEGDCESTKKQFRIHSRDVLIHLSDVVLETLNKLKDKISSSEMTEEEKEQLLADIEAQITGVQEAKAVLENLSDDLTREEVKEAIKTIKDAWSAAKPQIELGVGKLVGAKLGNIIVKTEQLETKFNRIRDCLETKGQDVSALDSYLEEFNGKLSEAKEHWGTAREQFGQARNAENVQAAVRAAHQHQTQARNLIKEAREDIRNIVGEIKGLNGLGETEEEAEENETEEDETEETEEEAEEEETEEETEE
jgi:chromosome segregation ATPase